MEFLNKLTGLAKRLPWKVGVLSFVLLLIFLAVSGFWPIKQKEASHETVKPVKVSEVKEETISQTLEYLGIVDAHDLKKIGFKLTGTLKKIAVTEGQPISKGEILAQLDTADLALAVEAAKNTRDNAESAYLFARDNYEKITKLQEAGAVSQQEADKARLEMENRQAGRDNAEIDYLNKLNALDDVTLKADIAGYVADVLYQEGEIIPGGYPVVIIRGEQLEIKIGLSQQDLGKVRTGTPARITAAGIELEGKVTSIGQLPDAQTRTYPTTIGVQETSLPLGMTVKVFLDLGEEKGIYIPINTINNDGQDYVYVIDNEMIARKKTVMLGKIRNTDVMVTGLAEGDRIVTEGIKSLRDGDRVSVQQ